MPTLEQLERSIASAEQLGTVVRTMKTIAAVSIRRYERASDAVRDYRANVERGLQIALRGHRVEPHRGAHGSPPGLIVVGSDQGMCGQFNDRAARYARQHLEQSGGREAAGPVLAVGRRLAGPLERAGIAPTTVCGLPGTLAGVDDAVDGILLVVDRWWDEDGVERVDVVHNQPRGGASYGPLGAALLPLDRRWLRELAGKPWPTRCLPTHTIGREPLLAALVRQHVYAALYRALLQSMASEAAARVASMQAAERNIDRRLDELRAAHRHERQRAITEELLDIVAGYEALRQDPS